MPRSDFEGFLKGKGALYVNFWYSQDEDLGQFSLPQREALFRYLNEQVFGVTLDDEDAEYERQEAFNEAKQRELMARAAKEEDNGDKTGGDEDKSGSDETGEVENHGEDNGKGSSQGRK